MKKLATYRSRLRRRFADRPIVTPLLIHGVPYVITVWSARAWRSEEDRPTDVFAMTSGCRIHFECETHDPTPSPIQRECFVFVRGKAVAAPI